jgi:hypothetical protein
MATTKLNWYFNVRPAAIIGSAFLSIFMLDAAAMAQTGLTYLECVRADNGTQSFITLDFNNSTVEMLYGGAGSPSQFQASISDQTINWGGGHG